MLLKQPHLRDYREKEAGVTNNSIFVQHGKNGWNGSSVNDDSTVLHSIRS